MSLEQWKKVYYQEQARDLVARGADDLELIDHSIKKWSGLDVETLNQYRLVRKGYTLIDIDDRDSTLDVNAATCTLCIKYTDTESFDDGCTTCPIKMARGGFSCDTGVDDDVELGNDDLSPWGRFNYHGETREMISALNDAREYVKKLPEDMFKENK